MALFQTTLSRYINSPWYKNKQKFRIKTLRRVLWQMSGFWEYEYDMISLNTRSRNFLALTVWINQMEMHGLLFRRRKDICIFPWLSTVRYSLESKLFGQRWAKLVTVRDSVETKQSNCRGQRSVSGTALRTIFLIYDFFLLHVHTYMFISKKNT